VIELANGGDVAVAVADVVTEIDAIDVEVLLAPSDSR
jgi:hypothetical protein